MALSDRVRKLNTPDSTDGPIVYWMNREIRVNNNWSLLYAQQLATERNQPLIVVYNLVTEFLGGRGRQLQFKLEGLQEVEENLGKLNIPFYLIIEKDGKNSGKEIIQFCNNHSAGALITDFYPLRLPRTWSDYVCQHIDCAFYEVDAHNIVPAWVVSDKKEYAAYTIRNKIYKHLPDYFESFPNLKKQSDHNIKAPNINWKSLTPTDIKYPIDWAIGGESQAQQFLKKFIKNDLESYATDRNDAVADVQSNLSPYLHYGMISRQDIALQIIDHVDTPIVKLMSGSRNKAKVNPDAKLTIKDHAGAFLEELIVRAELADNFCFYEPNYDNSRGFPSWAIETLHQHARDKREYIYTQTEFENAQTHDDLWNACQMQMVKSGKMHGYMRMYWAKKILEWTKNPDDAMAIAIYLNDTYELDGRDPNGYAGIAWSIGGIHDRPWFDRDVYGKVRYMARSGCEKKFDVAAYIETWT